MMDQNPGLFRQTQLNSMPAKANNDQWTTTADLFESYDRSGFLVRPLYALKMTRASMSATRDARYKYEMNKLMVETGARVTCYGFHTPQPGKLCGYMNAGNPSRLFIVKVSGKFDRDNTVLSTTEIVFEEEITTKNMYDIVAQHPMFKEEKFLEDIGDFFTNNFTHYVACYFKDFKTPDHYFRPGFFCTGKRKILPIYTLMVTGKDGVSEHNKMSFVTGYNLRTDNDDFEKGSSGYQTRRPGSLHLNGTSAKFFLEGCRLFLCLQHGNCAYDNVNIKTDCIIAVSEFKQDNIETMFQKHNISNEQVLDINHFFAYFPDYKQFLICAPPLVSAAPTPSVTITHPCSTCPCKQYTYPADPPTDSVFVRSDDKKEVVVLPEKKGPILDIGALEHDKPGLVIPFTNANAVHDYYNHGMPLPPGFDHESSEDTIEDTEIVSSSSDEEPEKVTLSHTFELIASGLSGILPRKRRCPGRISRAGRDTLLPPEHEYWKVKAAKVLTSLQQH